ncbi:H-type lectin domain-containing protein [Maritimibacter sp. UBA3975]|uniref:H-type lectin domain-containing protein n=1 Tax=Maritimibacter sp. UBA3975 TaxID=1946833 RepID=UPI0025C12EE1|nr:H-type lectin domain-containing protein [Maritimibacter sp. UBA3975]|tara:strand:+ start:52676 stop:53002 length:327 start_codon:yes stop_codon:yes gene_type:complete
MGIDRGSKVLFSDFVTDGAMWTGEGDREIRMLIPFSEPFTSAPAVMVGMSMWDIDAETNSRIDISSENITEKDFEIVFHTWGDTKVARIRADWVAFGEVADDDDWDVI